MSYLAPLNYDRFFKKVFKDSQIAKAFLEDFLDTKIESIEKLDEKHRVTDKSKIIEFDYRCKIGDKYIIIDMQQWYKPDVTQRFYVYHSANTALQLEDLQTKALPIDTLDEEELMVREIKDFRLLEPVLTLIWMVTDNLGFDNDFVSYKLLPEAVSDFIKNETIWYKENFIYLLKERNDVLKLIENKTKDIDFLPKNKLIFMFQKNIITNMNSAKQNESGQPTKYSRWFDFAQKTLKKDNSKEDFIEYENDVLFKEIMRRLDQSKLTDDDKQYISDQRVMWEKIGKYGRDFYEDGRKEGRLEGRLEGEKAKAVEIAKEMLRDGFPIDKIQKFTKLTRAEVETISKL